MRIIDDYDHYDNIDLKAAGKPDKTIAFLMPSSKVILVFGHGVVFYCVVIAT